MTQNQIRGGQIRSGTIANEQIASNAQIALSKIAGGTDLSNRVSNLEDDAVVTREVPSGSVNGTNTTFTLANTPVAGSEQVYLNGLLQDPGQGNSYTISGAVITFLSAPISGDEIHVTYATGNYMVAPGGSGGSGISAIVYQDAEFTWTNIGFGSPQERVITHNRGKRPDRIEVFAKEGDDWFLVNDWWRSTDNKDWGWYTQYISDVNSVKVMLNNFGIGTTSSRLCRIRLYWFTDTDVANFSSGGGFVNAVGGASGPGFTYTDSSVFTWPGNTSGNPTAQTYTHNHGAFPDKIEVLVESASGGWVPAPSVHAGGSSWYGCFVGDSSQNTVSVNFYGNLFNTTNTKIRCTWFE